MATYINDSNLFSHLFGTEDLRRIISDKNMVQKWFDVEAALEIFQRRNLST